MKNTFSPFRLRSLTFLGLVTFAGSIVSGASAPTTSDEAARLLASRGHVTVSSAGDFVAPATYRVQVLAKLGRPDLVLSDGTLLYHHRRIGVSDAVGTLVVRFAAGRVSSLSLVTPAVVAALRSNPRALETPELVAAK